jgi:ribonuclease P/MRP protein subunit RPP1
MKRVFADLNLKANPKDPQNFKRLINKAAAFGYRYISVPANYEMPPSESGPIVEACNQVGINYVSRINLNPKNPDNLTSSLRKLRRKFEVISVTCESKEVARQAAKDRRVDLISFSSTDYRKRFFDRAEAELASNCLTALEVDIKPLLLLDGPARVRFLATLRRELALAKEFHVPLVISSGAPEEKLMRMPRDMASLGFLFGLDEPSALDAVSKNPVDIVLRNKEKLERGFVAPGIRVVKAGKDC